MFVLILESWKQFNRIQSTVKYSVRKLVSGVGEDVYISGWRTLQINLLVDLGDCPFYGKKTLGSLVFLRRYLSRTWSRHRYQCSMSYETYGTICQVHEQCVGYVTWGWLFVWGSYITKKPQELFRGWRYNYFYIVNIIFSFKSSIFFVLNSVCLFSILLLIFRFFLTPEKYESRYASLSNPINTHLTGLRLWTCCWLTAIWYFHFSLYRTHVNTHTLFKINILFINPYEKVK